MHALGPPSGRLVKVDTGNGSVLRLEGVVQSECESEHKGEVD